MKFTVDGQTYQLIDWNDLTISEIMDMERVTGMSMKLLERLGETCVCAHFVDAHQHAENVGRPPAEQDMSCGTCPCPQFVDSSPAAANAAILWLSMRRDRPTVTFEETAAVSENSVTFEVEPAPKENPAPSEPDVTTTSEPSSTSSGSPPSTLTG